MNRVELRNRVLGYLRNRTGYDTTIDSMLNERCDAIGIPFMFPHLEIAEEVDTVAQQESIDIPTTIYAVQKIVNTTAQVYQPNRINVVDIDDIDDIRTELNIYRAPTLAGQFGSKLYLRSIPDGVYTLLLRGKRLPTPMASDSDEPEFPRDWHVIIAKLTAAEMHFMLGEAERGMEIKNEALGEIATRQEPRTIQRSGQAGQIFPNRKKPYRRGRIRGPFEE